MESWERAVTLSSAIPTGLAAKLSERALGPVLAARIVPVAPPETALAIGSKLPPEFLADIAQEMDPSMATETVKDMDADQIAAVTRLLAHREEHLVMADFCTAISDRALVATVDAIEEPALLRTVILIEDEGTVAQVVDALDDHRVEAVQHAAAEHGLEDHLAWLVGTLDEERASRFSAA